LVITVALTVAVRYYYYWKKRKAADLEKANGATTGVVDGEDTTSAIMQNNAPVTVGHLQDIIRNMVYPVKQQLEEQKDLYIKLHVEKSRLQAQLEPKSRDDGRSAFDIHSANEYAQSSFERDLYAPSQAETRALLMSEVGAGATTIVPEDSISRYGKEEFLGNVGAMGGEMQKDPSTAVVKHIENKVDDLQGQISSLQRQLLEAQSQMSPITEDTASDRSHPLKRQTTEERSQRIPHHDHHRRTRDVIGHTTDYSFDNWKPSSYADDHELSNLSSSIANNVIPSPLRLRNPSRIRGTPTSSGPSTSPGQEVDHRTEFGGRAAESRGLASERSRSSPSAGSRPSPTANRFQGQSRSSNESPGYSHLQHLDEEDSDDEPPQFHAVGESVMDGHSAFTAGETDLSYDPWREQVARNRKAQQTSQGSRTQGNALQAMMQERERQGREQEQRRRRQQLEGAEGHWIQRKQTAEGLGEEEILARENSDSGILQPAVYVAQSLPREGTPRRGRGKDRMP